MPRKGKGSKVAPVDMPGAPNRVPTIDAPQPAHGQRKELVESHQAAPPGRNPLTQASPSGGPPRPGGSPDDQAIQAALAGMQGGGPLDAPPSTPTPITSGVGVGPGPGREAVARPRQSASAQIERLALIYDDPGLMELARTARQRGL